VRLLYTREEKEVVGKLKEGRDEVRVLKEIVAAEYGENASARQDAVGLHDAYVICHLTNPACRTASQHVMGCVMVEMQQQSSRC